MPLGYGCLIKSNINLIWLLIYITKFRYKWSRVVHILKSGERERVVLIYSHLNHAFMVEKASPYHALLGISSVSWSSLSTPCIRLHVVASVTSSVENYLAYGRGHFSTCLRNVFPEHPGWLAAVNFQLPPTNSLQINVFSVIFFSPPRQLARGQLPSRHSPLPLYPCLFSVVVQS